MGPLEAATQADLDRWGKVGTVLGVLALVLARRIDSGVDSGSGLAVLAKTLTTFWKELYSFSEDADSPLSELRRRRGLRRVQPADEPWNPDEDGSL